MTRKGKQTAQKKKNKAVKQEVTRLGAALRMLGRAGGGMAGGVVGLGQEGAGLGQSLGASLSRWLGSGDYSVRSNSLVNSLKASGTIPSMHRNDQTVVVRHKEFVTQVYSSQDFEVQRTFVLNPGLQSTFPWLHAIAANYQQYSIKGMVFHYVPSSGAAVSGTSGALGTVMLQTSYRSTDDPPSSKVEILNEYWASESVPSNSFAHPIECSPLENPFNVHYTRTGELPSDENQLMYDVGATHLAVSGQQSDGQPIGDLWISYEIELKKPILQSDVTSQSHVGYIYNDSSPTFADLLGPSPQITGSIPMTANARDIFFPTGSYGEYYMLVRVASAAPWFTNPVSMSAPVVLTNMTLQDVDGVNPRWETVTETSGTLRTGTAVFRFKKDNPGLVGRVALPVWSASGTAIAQVNIVIIQID